MLKHRSHFRSCRWRHVPCLQQAQHVGVTLLRARKRPLGALVWPGTRSKRRLSASNAWPAATFADRAALRTGWPKSLPNDEAGRPGARTKQRPRRLLRKASPLDRSNPQSCCGASPSINRIFTPRPSRKTSFKAGSRRHARHQLHLPSLRPAAPARASQATAGVRAICRGGREGAWAAEIETRRARPKVTFGGAFAALIWGCLSKAISSRRVAAADAPARTGRAPAGVRAVRRDQRAEYACRWERGVRDGFGEMRRVYL
jgi:hypothetical protein